MNSLLQAMRTGLCIYIHLLNLAKYRGTAGEDQPDLLQYLKPLTVPQWL